MEDEARFSDVDAQNDDQPSESERARDEPVEDDLEVPSSSL